MIYSTLNIIPPDIIASGMVMGSVITAKIISIVFVLCSIISKPQTHEILDCHFVIEM